MERPGSASGRRPAHIAQLLGLNQLWEYQLTLTTFILTFFTSQSYSHWRSVYFTTRAVQGRANDMCLLLALGAERSKRIGSSGYSERGGALLNLCSRLIRLSNTFFWAATPTCSNGVGDGGVEDGDERSHLSRDLRQIDAIGPLLLVRVSSALGEGIVRVGGGVGWPTQIDVIRPLLSVSLVGGGVG